jgi:hypothetical protein
MRKRSAGFFEYTEPFTTSAGIVRRTSSGNSCSAWMRGVAGAESLAAFRAGDDGRGVAAGVGPDAAAASRGRSDAALSAVLVVGCSGAMGAGKGAGESTGTGAAASAGRDCGCVGPTDGACEVGTDGACEVTTDGACEVTTDGACAIAGTWSRTEGCAAGDAETRGAAVGGSGCASTQTSPPVRRAPNTAAAQTQVETRGAAGSSPVKGGRPWACKPGTPPRSRSKSARRKASRM